METRSKTVLLKLDIPIDIEIVDENDNVIGAGSGTITVTKELQYSYEVPDIRDYLLKGSAPAIVTDIVLKGVLK